MMRFLILLVAVVLAAALGSYAILNVDERVDVSLPGADLRGIPQVYLVLAAAGLGALLTGILSLADGIRLRLRLRRLQRELDMLRDEVPASARSASSASPPEDRQGPFRGGSGEPATRPVIPSAGSSSSTDRTPPYGV